MRKRKKMPIGFRPLLMPKKTVFRGLITIQKIFAKDASMLLEEGEPVDGISRYAVIRMVGDHIFVNDCDPEDGPAALKMTINIVNGTTESPYRPQVQVLIEKTSDRASTTGWDLIDGRFVDFIPARITYSTLLCDYIVNVRATGRELSGVVDFYET